MNPRLVVDANQELGSDSTAPRFGISKERVPALQLAQEQRERIKAWGTQWPEHAGDGLLSEVDLAWMQEIRRFGYWRLEKQSVWADLEEIDLLTLPLPSLMDLRALCKLRLLKGLGEPTLTPALEDVRHLSWLLYSTHVAIAAVVGLSNLSLESELHQALREMGDARATSWNPIASEVPATARRVFLARLYMSSLMLTRDTFAATLPTAPLRPGDCLVFSQATWWMLASRSALEERLRDHFTLFGDRLAEFAGSCRAEWQLSLWRGESRQRVADLSD
ncbi:MAG: hypothetical protein HYZ27_07970, partial [Deltaproteobacteria bacterium]|nr:hypothetical protein [Deltaproteobacteria bacterium]